MKFRYSARTKSGELQVGYIEAMQKDAATMTLTNHGLYVLSLEEVRPPKWYESLLFYFKRVKRKDLVIFTRQFATMLEAKISIHDALDALYYQTDNQTLRESIFNILTDVDSGIPLSQAFERQSAIFFQFYVHLLQSAEVTGQVEDAMGYLADYLEKELVLTAKVKNALIYPALVIVLSIVVGGILIGLVFPQIAPIFAEAEFDLPVITQIFLAVGTFINAWWFAIVIFLVILGFLFAGYVRTGEGKAVVNQVIVQMPAVGEFFKKLYVARFSQITSVLVKGGIPIAQAIEISGHTVGSALYQEALHDIAEGVRRGELLSRAFERHTELFPPLVTQMVTVGEQTGKLDEMMVRVSTFYGREVDNIVGNIVELIQPALIIFIGTIVAFLFAAILLPIYSLVQVIR